MANHIFDEVAYENAIVRNIRNNAMKTFLKSESNKTALEYIQANAYKGGFFGSLNSAFETYGKLTENQVNAVLKIIASNEEKKLEWAQKRLEADLKGVHIGNVKERLTLTLSCVAVIELQGISFGYYDNGISYMQIFHDPEGNVFKYTGKNVLIEKNETATIKATIKEHADYNGVKQTVIQRPSIVK